MGQRGSWRQRSTSQPGPVTGHGGISGLATGVSDRAAYEISTAPSSTPLRHDRDLIEENSSDEDAAAERKKAGGVIANQIEPHRFRGSHCTSTARRSGRTRPGCGSLPPLQRASLRVCYRARPQRLSSLPVLAAFIPGVEDLRYPRFDLARHRRDCFCVNLTKLSDL